MIQRDSQTIPADIEAEKAVLGSLLIDGEGIYKIHSYLKPFMFFNLENQTVYEACCKLCERGEAINQITVAHELVSMKKFEEIGRATYLSHLVSCTPTSVLIEHYARVVQNCALQRMVISMGSQVTSLGYEVTDPNELLSKVGSIYLKVQENVSQPQLLSPKEWAEKSMTKYSNLGSGKKVSISTGFTQLDWSTGGIFPEEFWVLAGDPRIGKTTLAVQWAENLSYKGNVLFCSLEMPYHDITDRRVSMRTGKQFRVLRSGNWDDETAKAVQKAIGEIAESGVYYFGQSASDSVGGSVTTQAIYATARYMKMAYGLSAIVVDYLQAVGDDEGRTEQERVSRITRRLQSIPKSLSVPLIALCQLNREASKREGRRPRINELRWSGDIEYAADVILLVYRDVIGDDDTIQQDEAEIEIGKQRQSDFAKQFVKLKWDAKKHIYFEDEKEKPPEVEGWWQKE